MKPSTATTFPCVLSPVACAPTRAHHELPKLATPRQTPLYFSFPAALRVHPIHSLPCFWRPNSIRSSARPQQCFRPSSFPPLASTHPSCSLIPNLALVPQLRLTLRPPVLRGTGSSLPRPRALCRRLDCPLQVWRRPGPSSPRFQDPEGHSTCSCSSGGEGFPPGATPTCLHPLP